MVIRFWTPFPVSFLSVGVAVEDGLGNLREEWRGVAGGGPHAAHVAGPQHAGGRGGAQ